MFIEEGPQCWRFTIKRNNLATVHGLCWNMWGLAKMEEACGGEHHMSILQRTTQGRLNQKDLLSIFYGGLEGYRQKVKRKRAPYTQEEAADILEELFGVNFIEAVREVCKVFFQCFPHLESEARKVMEAMAEEAEGEDAGEVETDSDPLSGGETTGGESVPMPSD